MGLITLQNRVLTLHENQIDLLKDPFVSAGEDHNFLYSHFIRPKQWEFVQGKAKERGYAQVASNGQDYIFFHEGGSIEDEDTYRVACDTIHAQMPPLPAFTKYLGIDLKDVDQNERLQGQIDELGLEQLETIIRKTGFQGRRTTATFGSSGVIIAMTDLYDVQIKY